MWMINYFLYSERAQWHLSFHNSFFVAVPVGDPAQSTVSAVRTIFLAQICVHAKARKTVVTHGLSTEIVMMSKMRMIMLEMSPALLHFNEPYTNV